MNCTVNSHKKQTRLCRSFKYFDSKNFIQDMEKVDFETITTCEDVNEAYVNFSREFLQVVKSLRPELKFKVLFTSFDLFVRITSSKLGLEVPIKHVGALI
jgi:hypothetical protein